MIAALHMEKAEELSKWRAAVWHFHPVPGISFWQEQHQLMRADLDGWISYLFAHSLT